MALSLPLPRLARLRDSAFLAIFLLLLLGDVWLIVQAATPLPSFPGALAFFARAALVFFASGALGWLLADLASGVIHFIADNWGSRETPIFGRLLIAPFREHHDAPLTILEHGFLERNANNALIALPLLGWIPLFDLTRGATFFAACVSCHMALWAAATNEIHAAAHAPTAPWWVKRLQNVGLLLTPEHHRLHHTAITSSPARSGFHYCITSGVCDRWAQGFSGALRGKRDFR